MKLHRTSSALLRLGGLEGRLLAALDSDTGASISRLARTARMPRATVTVVLGRLKRRGLAMTAKVGKRHQWLLAPTHARLKLSQTLLRSLLAHGSTSDEQSVKSGELAIDIGRGVASIARAYRGLGTLGRGERIYAIQGNLSAHLSLKKLDPHFFHELHRAYKKRTIVIDGVIGERSLELVRQMSDADLRSHHGRAVVTVVLPNAYLDFDEDIVVYKDTMLLVNFSQELVVTIRNPLMVEAMRTLIRLFQDAGRKVDLNAVIAEELARRKA